MSPSFQSLSLTAALLLSGTSLAMASREVRSSHRTAFTPVLSQACELAPPVRSPIQHTTERTAVRPTRAHVAERASAPHPTLHSSAGLKR
jgi:hypothetical protein